MSYIWISSQDRIDVSRKFRPLILIDCVCDIGRRTLYLYPSTNTALRLMSRRRCWSASFGSTAETSNSAAWYIVLGWRCLLAADFGYELEQETNQLIVQLMFPSLGRQFVPNYTYIDVVV